MVESVISFIEKRSITCLLQDVNHSRVILVYKITSFHVGLSDIYGPHHLILSQPVVSFEILYLVRAGVSSLLFTTANAKTIKPTCTKILFYDEKANNPDFWSTLFV
jgi:hypothetical protein